MRTMSDRCLERRITPALFRTQGFLTEKLVEGKEGTETPPIVTTATPTATTTASSSSAAGTPPSPSTHQAPPPPSSEPPPGGKEEGAGDGGRVRARQNEALWDLFQSESSFLYDHLMVLKNVSFVYIFSCLGESLEKVGEWSESFLPCCFSQVFMEPLKRIQVEGFAMYAEPELLFGNLDELCAVTYAFCKEFIHLLLTLTDPNGQLPTTQVLAKLFEPVRREKVEKVPLISVSLCRPLQSSKARAMSQAYHRYALNYINALNYLDTLRRHGEFCDFEKVRRKLEKEEKVSELRETDPSRFPLPSSCA